MVVWGGYGVGLLNTGGRYDPATDSSTPTTNVNALAARRGHTAVWTGSLMMVWGRSPLPPSLNTGGAYVVSHVRRRWGRHSESDGDCDDGNGAIYPSAPELCDGFTTSVQVIPATGRSTRVAAYVQRTPGAGLDIREPRSPLRADGHMDRHGDGHLGRV